MKYTLYGIFLWQSHPFFLEGGLLHVEVEVLGTVNSK